MELNRQQIKQRLKDLGVTQRQIAHQNKVNPAHVSNVIAGKRKSQRIVNFLSLIFGEYITIQATKAKVTPIRVKPFIYPFNNHREKLSGSSDTTQ